MFSGNGAATIPGKVTRGDEYWTGQILSCRVACLRSGAFGLLTSCRSGNGFDGTHHENLSEHCTDHCLKQARSTRLDPRAALVDHNQRLPYVDTRFPRSRLNAMRNKPEINRQVQGRSSACAPAPPLPPTTPGDSRFQVTACVAVIANPTGDSLSPPYAATAEECRGQEACTREG